MTREFEFETRKGGRSVLRWLLRENITRDQWKRIGVGVFVQPSLYDEFIDEVDEAYNDFERGENQEYSEIIEGFKNTIYHQLNKKIQRMDQLSQIVAMELNPTHDADEYWMLSPEVYTDWVGPPHYSIITAPKGKGKTSTEAKMAQALYERESHLVVGNIPMKGNVNVEGYTNVTLFSDALLEAVKNTREGVNTLLSWDEATLSLMKAQATRKTSITFEKVDTLLRKLKVDIQISYVLEKDVHTRLEQQWSQWLKKLDKRTISIEQRQGNKTQSFFKVIKGWPDAEWPYDSENFDVLEIDLDVDDLLSAIRNTASLEDKLNVMEDFLKNIKKSPYLKSLSREQKVIMAWQLSNLPVEKVRRSRTLTQGEIAKVLGCSQKTVSNMIEEATVELDSNIELRKQLHQSA